MADDVSRFIESEIAKRFKRAEELYEDKRFDEALRILDELDRQSPNQKEILLQRNRCLKAAGRDRFVIDPAKAKEQARFGAGVWDSEDIVSRPAIKMVTGQLSEETQPVWEPEAGVEFEVVYELAPKDDDFRYKMILLAMILILGFGMYDTFFGEPRAGEERTFAGMAFVWVPPLPVAEDSTMAQDANGSESPLPHVPFSGGFWLGKYEVTRAQWKGIMEKGASRPSDDERRMPMAGVTPDMGAEFVERLNRQGEGWFRFPTGAEWKRGALAVARTAFSFGNNPGDLGGYAWYSGNSGGTIHRVGEKMPNAWGLHDIGGNVSEWCLQLSDADVAEGIEDTRLLAGRVPEVLRGGDASAYADGCRPSSAELAGPDTSFSLAGMRLRRDPGPSTKDALRSLDFPRDRSLGTLFIGKRRLGPARGRVTALLDDRLRLEVSRDELENLAYLSALDANALAEISMAGVEAKDEHLAHIKGQTGLEVLDVSRNLISDLGLVSIEGLESLVELDLSETAVAGKGLKFLANMKNLEVLNLKALGNIGNAHLDALATLEALKSLDLRDTNVTPAAITKLQVALPRCKIKPEPELPTLEQSLEWARVRGRYSILLHQFEASDDSKAYGYFAETGYSERVSWLSLKDLPPGYWVYVRPFWYIWDYEKDETPRNNRAWGPEKAVGKPDTAGEDHSRVAWAPMTDSDDKDWLMVEFENPILPRGLRLYHARPQCPDIEIGVFNLAGDEILARRSSPPNPSPLAEGWMSILDLQDIRARTAVEFNVNRVKLYFEPVSEGDESSIGAEVDAVALVDGGGGYQWTSGSSCSSFLQIEEPEEIDNVEEEIEQKKSIDPSEIEFRGFPGVVKELVSRQG